MRRILSTLAAVAIMGGGMAVVAPATAQARPNPETAYDTSYKGPAYCPSYAGCRTVVKGTARR